MAFKIIHSGCPVEPGMTATWFHVFCSKLTQKDFHKSILIVQHVINDIKTQN